MDVLVFTPVWRLEEETVKAVLGLEPVGPISFLFQKDNPGEDGKRNHLHQYRRGREVFLAGRFEAMLVVESDIIPPWDALSRLAALDCDVAYGVYRFRQCEVINVFEKYPDKNGVPPRNIGESLSLHPDKLRRAVRDGVVECSGAGLGCVLIKRKVLEVIDFWREDEGAHCDTYFNRDAMREGFRQMADMSVVCGHKDERGVIHWPELGI